MFDFLSDKLTNVFARLGSRGKLTEKDIDSALREVRLALLEADVNFKVVKDFISRVRARSLESIVLKSLTPAQQIVKIVNEELVTTLGESNQRLAIAAKPPTVVMLVGLQGSGKTTTVAKLGLHLKNTGQSPLLVAADNRRPAAIEQLVTLSEPLKIPVYHETQASKPQDICRNALKEAARLGANWVIIDTAGRVQIDAELMAEIDALGKTVKPDEILLVVDAMTGQDAVRIATEFHQRLRLTGLILTKMDGDARGGAALSIRWVSGVPVKFIATGERAAALEPFHPDRLASRILGMGDMLSFIEKAEASFDVNQTAKLEDKIKSSKFGLDDFLEQMRELQKMGPLSQLVDMIPGLPKTAGNLEAGEGELKKVESIILSMTPEERSNPAIIGGRRRKRIARGSGNTPQDINQLLNRFSQMQKLLKQGMKGKLPKNLMGNFYSR
jgi:signal recognition particle subunit SRP54